jgi:hypothetical protein
MGTYNDCYWNIFKKEVNKNMDIPNDINKRRKILKFLNRQEIEQLRRDKKEISERVIGAIRKGPFLPKTNEIITNESGRIEE